MCVCSFPGFSPEHLRPLALLQDLALIESEISNFTVPNGAWQQLTRLELEGNRLTQLPHNLTVLTSLVCLGLDGQYADFQLTEEMRFLTQLSNLRRVSLCKMGACCDRYVPYDSGSLFALLHGQLLIKNTPNCQVELCT